MNKISTRNIILGGLLTAISIVLTRMFAFMLFDGTVRISLGSIPIMLSGIIMGPLVGGLVGAISDVIGITIVSQGVPHIGFTLSSALTGIIPGLLMHSSFKNKNTSSKKLFALVVLSVLAVSIIVSMCLNTFWLSQLQGKAFLVLLPTRLIGTVLIGIASVVILYPLILKLKKEGFK